MEHTPAGPGRATDRPRLRPEFIIGLGGLLAAAHSSMMIILPVLPRFMTELGGAVFFGATFSLGLALTSSSVGRFLTNIPAGALSEKIGRRKVLVVGGLVVAIFASLGGTAPNAPMFWLYRFMGGVGSAMVITVANVVATDVSTVENRGRVLSLMHGISLVVGIASPALGGLLAETISVRSPFYASGILISVFTVWALFRLPETRSLVALAHRAEQAARGRFATLGLLRDTNFFLVCMLAFATFFLRGGATSGLAPLYADQFLGLGPGLLGVLFAVSALLHSLLIYPAGVMADRVGRKPVIVPAGILVTLGVTAIPFTTDVFMFVAAFIFLHAAVGFGGQAPTAYLGDIAPPGMRGVSFGMYRTFGDAAGIVGPLIATGLAGAISFKAAFLFGAVLWTVVLLAFARFAKETAGPRRNARIPDTTAAP